LVLFSDEALNRIDVQIIYPAPPKTVSKYAKSSRVMVLETPALYEKQVQPYILELGAKHHQWIYNVLDKGEEAEKTIWKDKRSEEGFTLLYNYTHLTGRFTNALTDR
jgi:hypothetical protein